MCFDGKSYLRFPEKPDLSLTDGRVLLPLISTLAVLFPSDPNSSPVVSHRWKAQVLELGQLHSRPFLRMCSGPMVAT